MDTKWLSEDEQKILSHKDDPFRSELNLFAARLAAEREKVAELVEALNKITRVVAKEVHDAYPSLCEAREIAHDALAKNGGKP